MRALVDAMSFFPRTDILAGTKRAIAHATLGRPAMKLSMVEGRRKLASSSAELHREIGRGRI